MQSVTLTVKVGLLRVRVPDYMNYTLDRALRPLQCAATDG
jgi:hypothetical protein